MKTMINEEYLQPCPICSATPKITTVRISEKHRISTSFICCENCGLILLGQHGKYYKRSEIITLWNTRTNKTTK